MSKSVLVNQGRMPPAQRGFGGMSLRENLDLIINNKRHTPVQKGGQDPPPLDPPLLITPQHTLSFNVPVLLDNRCQHYIDTPGLVFKAPMFFNMP